KGLRFAFLIVAGIGFWLQMTHPSFGDPLHRMGGGIGLVGLCAGFSVGYFDPSWREVPVVDRWLFRSALLAGAVGAGATVLSVIAPSLPDVAGIAMGVCLAFYAAAVGLGIFRDARIGKERMRPSTVLLDRKD